MKHLTHETEPTNLADGSGGLLPKKLRNAIFRYRWTIVLVTATVATLVTLWTLRMPKLYQATTTLEYDPNPASPLGSSVEDVGGQVSHFWITREFFETQNLIIQSRAIAERVVERLGLLNNAGFLGQKQNGDSETLSLPAAAQILQEKLSVEPIEDTRLVRVHVVDNDPERAATLANSIARAYIDKTMEDRVGSTAAAAEWLAQRLDTTRKQLNEAELSLHEFKKRNNVLSVSLEDRQNLLAKEIREYNERLTQARARRIELEARLRRLRSARHDPQAMPRSLDNTASDLGALRSELRAKQTERASLSIRYGDSHPTIRELDRQVSSLSKSIDDEIDSLIKVANANLKEIRSVEGGLRKVQRRVTQAGLDLNLREIHYSRLQRQRESNAKLYDLLLQRTAETDLTRLLRTTYVRVVDRAVVPEVAVAPMPMVNILGGILGGALLGLAIAVLLQKIDRRIVDIPDVEQLGLTILGVFPHVGDAATTKQSARLAKGKKPPAAGTQPVEQIVHLQPMSMAAEACRAIRTNLDV